MNKQAAPLLVTFALPDESHPFLRTLGALVSTMHRGPAPELPTYLGQRNGRPVTVVHTGVGDTAPGRARLKTVLATTAHLRCVISAGYAGGLSPALRVGDLFLGENFSDPALLRSARRLLQAEEPLHVGPLLTSTGTAETVAAKAVLHAATGALAVDMETRWIGDLCSQAGVPFLSLRVISDAATDPFPVPGHILFDAVRQRPRYLALPFHLLTHPARLAPFARFVQALPAARARLTRALIRLVGTPLPS